MGLIRPYAVLLFLVGAGLASIFGLFVTVKEQLAWGIALYVSTFLLANACFAFQMYWARRRAEERCASAVDAAEREAAAARAAAAGERRGRVEAESRLNQAASLVVVQLQAALLETGRRQHLQALYSTFDFLARMTEVLAATGGAIEVRQVVREGDALYVIVRADDTVLALVRAGDRFVLTKSSATKVQHAVAGLEAYQVGGTMRKSIAFLVKNIVDYAIHDGLAALSRTTDVKGLEGLAVVPELDPQLVAGLDMQMVCRAIKRVEAVLIPVRETEDGN
jgi:hypothetical protein